MAKATGHPPSTGAATSRVTTLISFAGIVALLRHRIHEYLAGDQSNSSGWAFENIRYLPDGKIDVSPFLTVLLTEVLSDNRGFMEHDSRLRESQSVLRHMGLDEDQARGLTDEMFSATLTLIGQHLPEITFRKLDDYDFLLTQLDLIAIQTVAGARATTSARPAP